MKMKLAIILMASVSAVGQPKAAPAPSYHIEGQSDVITLCCPKPWNPHWINSQQGVCKRLPQTEKQRMAAMKLVPVPTPHGYVSKPATEPKPIKDENVFDPMPVDAGFSAPLSLISNYDLHGCMWGFSWDESRKACGITVVFSFTSQKETIQCSPVVKNIGDTNQTMICWYEPKPVASPEGESK